VSLRLRFLPLRRRFRAACGRPVSPECVRVAVLGLSDYGRCAFGSGLPRFSHDVLRGGL
jgi:hypothetical protein